jgi:1-acyl-sn-glycerol-3-phosphate acyltransferase
MIMIPLLRFATRTAALLTSTFLCWTCLEFQSLLCRRCRRIDLINLWVSRWARLILWIYHIGVEAGGPHVDQRHLYPSCAGPGHVGRVFVMNHRSGIDIPIVFTVAEAHAISRHDLATWPLFGWSARRAGTLFVDRGSRRSGATVLQEIDRALKVGEGVIMFPEGTSYPGDEVRPFRPGAFNAARRAGAEVVPLGVAYGDNRAYYYQESFLSHLKRVASLRKLRVAVEVGQPLATKGLSPIEVIALARQQVQELVDQARARLDG